MPKFLKKNPKLLAFILILIAAVFIRFLLIFNYGFEADISFWKSWGLAVFDHGIVWASQNTNNNYPSPFAYLLGAIVGLYSLFADPHNFNEFWNNGNYLFLAAAKLPSILADFGIAGIIFWLGKNAKRVNFPIINVIPGDNVSFYSILAVIYLLNPVSLIDGAWWGQVDSLGVFVFLLAVTAALVKKPGLAGVIFMVSMMTKLQNMIYGPLFFLFLWQYSGYEGLVRGLAGSALAFFGLNFEFLLAGQMRQVVSSLTVNFDYFPYLSLNAFNLWWIVASGHGMQVSDKLLSLGIINSKTLGLLLFSSFYLLAVIYLLFRQFKERGPEEKPKLISGFLIGLIIVNAAFFLFQTQSHDRYAFPISVFLLLLAPFLISQFKLKLKTFVTCYLLFSLIYFYNLHTALVINYPRNGLPALSLFTQTPITIAASILLILLFAGFIVFVLKKTPPFIYVAPLIILTAIILALNLPLITKSPVSLTKFKPYISQQEYGQLQVNLPLNAGQGFKGWSPLSDQYYFYQKGFGTHAGSRLSFDVGGQFKKFSTDYGIDTEAGSQGLAIFKISGDGKKLFTSGNIGRYDAPRHAEVDISGVKILSLETLPVKATNNDDHTDWLNPILWP